MTPADEAKRLSILLEYGLPVERDAIAWADSQIAATDSPSDALLELSTTPADRRSDILSHLHELAVGASFWCALQAAMPRLHEHLLSHPSDAERIARDLFRIVVSSPDAPQEFEFAYHFDDAFQLARDRVFGDLESVHREFMEELAQFTAKA